MDEFLFVFSADPFFIARVCTALYIVINCIVLMCIASHLGLEMASAS